MKRRQFVFGIFGAAAIGLCGTRYLSSPLASKDLNSLAKFSKTGHALGSKVVISVFHSNETQAQTALDEAFQAIEQVENLMSLYRTDSQLVQLNKRGFLKNPHRDLVQVLESAVQLSKQSEGAFDISVQPLWQAYEIAAKKDRLPSESELATAQEKVDWSKIEITSNTVALRKQGMALTLNGIAQGFAADAASTVLKAYGIQHALIDSGEISTVGSPVNREEWNIAIKHPRQTDSYLGLAALQGRCLATSGDYESTFTDNFEQHHLLDPRTGKSPRELSSVTIAAPTAMEADALSTAVFLMGLEKGKELIESLPNIDALFVDKTNHTSRTGNFPLMS